MKKYNLLLSYLLILITPLNKTNVLHAADNDDLTLAELKQKSIDEIAGFSYFNGNDYGIVTPVKNQLNYNLCWAFSAVSAAETSILYKQLEDITKDELDFDERNLAYTSFYHKVDEFNNTAADYYDHRTTWNVEAYTFVAADAMLQWAAPVDQLSDDPNNQSDDRRSEIESYYDTKYLLDNFIEVNATVEDIKKAIAKYGAVTVTFDALTNYEGQAYYLPTYYNIKANTYSTNYTHTCVIVGWDDNVDASLFKPEAASINGAWIVKNSWGDSWYNDEGIDGYFYISYDSTDKKLLDDLYVFDMTHASDYNHLYYYDGTITPSRDIHNIRPESDHLPIKAAAVYQAKASSDENNEMFSAVNLGIFGNDVDIKIEIYTGLNPDYDNPMTPQDPTKGGVLRDTINTNVATSGYYTIKLNNPFFLEPNENFSIVVDIDNPTHDALMYYAYDNDSNNDMTFLFNKNTNQWENCKKHSEFDNIGALHVRAYTNDVSKDVSNATIELDNTELVYDGNEKLPVVIVTSGNYELKLNEDYTIEYENNVDASSLAKVNITGINRFNGTISKYFTINKADAPYFDPSFMEIFNENIVIDEDTKYLNDIPLPDGWTWVDGGTELKNGLMKVTCYYSNEDAINYTNVTKDFDLYLSYERVDDKTFSPFYLFLLIVPASLIITGIVFEHRLKKSRNNKY